jgi:hypothetical protein
MLFVTACVSRPVTELSPTTNNLFVDQIKQTAIDKIDLLFMIDNSVSMSDKQEILKEAVPVLLSRLVSPICVDETGKVALDSAGKRENSQNGSCPNTHGQPEFNPIGDIHIGIVSSSLGAHGATVPGCADVAEGNDRGRLVATMRSGVTTWNSNSGFLAWDVSGKANVPAGTADPAALNLSFQNLVGSVHDMGCGYEASLESWYRFLIDPEPPAQVSTATVNEVKHTVRNSARTVNADGTLGACTGCDDTLLAQRKAFLRPDSLVAIIMLSDENDCSIRDDGSGWFVGSGGLDGRMPKSTTACDANPNDPCCRTCFPEASTPAGCAAQSADDHCKTTAKYATLSPTDDQPNLRCYNQRQRFGFDLLYPTSRYVDALKNTTILLQSSGHVVTNPLYDSVGSGKAPRDPSLVFLAGIVGVPWQDIADDASLTDPAGLKYLTAKELQERDRWQVVLGVSEPGMGKPPVAPSDPFMVETSEPRVGMNPIAKISTSPASSTDPKANVINGHEQNIPNRNDLQYACTFPLKTPKLCTFDDKACDCSPKRDGSTADVVTANSPLCQPPGGGPAGTTQYAAKAYPGTRELQVLKDFGDNAIVASICPKVTTPAGSPESDANYGYNPAVGAIIERLKDALKGKCLPRKIQTDDMGQVLCRVVEAQKADCDCTLPGRAETDSAILAAVRKQLKLSGQCGKSGQESCETWCQCEVKQEQGAALASCQAGGAPAGYCYVNDPKSALLKDCPENQKQLLRFAPAPNAVAFIACLGQSVSDADSGM